MNGKNDKYNNFTLEIFIRKNINKISTSTTACQHLRLAILHIHKCGVIKHLSLLLHSFSMYQIRLY